MSASRLSEVIKRINTIDNVKSEPLEKEILEGTFKQYKVYKLSNVEYRTSTDPQTVKPLIVVDARPNTQKADRKRVKTPQEILRGVNGQAHLKKHAVATNLRHYYLYYNEAGRSISEYTEHSDFMDFTRTHPNQFSMQEIKRFIAQILLTIHKYFHSKNLIHGDIKPDNFLVFERGGKYFLKITDFDDILEVDAQGKSSYPLVTGSEDYIDKQSKYLPIREVNRKQSDCYATGITIYFIILHLLAVSERDKIVKIDEKEKAVFQDMLGNSPEWHLSEIFHRLISDSLYRRINIEGALKSPFFGESESVRKQYFADIEAEAKCDLWIDNYRVNPLEIKINDAFFLLDKEIKPLVRAGQELADQIEDYDSRLTRRSVLDNTETVKALQAIASKADGLHQSVEQLRVSSSRYQLFASSLDPLDEAAKFESERATQLLKCRLG